MFPEEQALLMLELDKVKVHCSSEFWLDPQCELLRPQLLLPSQSKCCILPSLWWLHLLPGGLRAYGMKSEARCFVSGILLKAGEGS